MLKTEVIKTSATGPLLHDASRPWAVLFYQGCTVTTHPMTYRSRKVVGRYTTKKAAQRRADAFLSRVIELG